MKKILLILVTLLFTFTLSACQEDTTIQDSIDDLDSIVAGNIDDTYELSLKLAQLKGELITLQGQSFEADKLIAQALEDISDIETAIFVLKSADVSLEKTIQAIEAQISALSAVVALLVTPTPTLWTSNTTEIVIVHTNDVHGRVNADSYGGVLGMAALKNVMDVLEEAYENVFLVSAGDIVHGTTFATLEEGASVINVMNQVGYDLMVPGNHDFDYGQEQLLVLEALAQFPMISANIQYAADDTDFMNPYFIQDFDGVKVGFFGLTTPETTYKTHPDNVIGLNFLDPIAQATAMVAELDPLVDIIICLAHIGVDEATLVTTEDIANQVAGIDVIIDGHSHTEMANGMMVGNTLIVSAGEYMQNFGALKMSVRDGEIIAIDAVLISADEVSDLGYGSDAAIQAYIDAIVADQAIILNEVVGQTAVVLDGERADVRTGETNLGNIIADSMVLVTGADVAFTNGGGIRASIAVGEVTLGDIITVLPFGNIIHTKDVTGAVLLAILEKGTASYPNQLGAFPHVSGITFTINTTNPAGSRVEDVMVNGVALNLSATYSLATNDFLAAGGDGYDMLVGIPTTGEYMGLHESLASMFTVGVDIVVPAQDRITVVE